MDIEIHLNCVDCTSIYVSYKDISNAKESTTPEELCTMKIWSFDLYLIKTMQKCTMYNICLVVPCASTLYRCVVVFMLHAQSMYIGKRLHIHTSRSSTITNLKTTMSTYLHRIEQKLKRESNPMISFHSASNIAGKHSIPIHNNRWSHVHVCRTLYHSPYIRDDDDYATINIWNCCWNEKNISHTAPPSPTLYYTMMI